MKFEKEIDGFLERLGLDHHGDDLLINNLPYPRSTMEGCKKNENPNKKRRKELKNT